MTKHFQPANDSTKSGDEVDALKALPEAARLPKLVFDRATGEGLYRLANGHEPECWDGGCNTCELHAETCICDFCNDYRWEREGLKLEDFIERLEADRHAARLARALPAFLKVLPYGFDAFTRHITLDASPKLPALLTRDDGETLLYEARLNSIFGEPGTGKTWLAIITAIGAVRAGARVLWWDFEDRPSTLATCLQALGSVDLIGRPELRYIVPSIVEDEAAMFDAVKWTTDGERPGLVVIDSCESAGCPADSNNVAPWYEKHVNPWINAGTGVLLLDHVPKRREDRPRGGIGSQYKLGRVDGAALFVQGRPWTKTTDGQIAVTLHKDRPGDLPGTVGKTVAVFNGVHQNGFLDYSIKPPGKDDEADVSDDLLYEIAKMGTDGVTGSRGVRDLVKAQGKAVDGALNDLISNGLVARRKVGRAWLYYATPDGQSAIEQGGD